MLQSRSIEKEQPNRANERPNKSLNWLFDEAKRRIDEEESNRLTPLDGYTKPPPRPREGSGVKLRPQHHDINEYFTGPKWYDSNTRHERPFVESAETKPSPPPQIERKPKPKVLHRDQGKKVSRPEPP